MRNTIFVECECNEEGVTESICDSKTDACLCKPGVHGNKCQGKLKPTILSQLSEHKEFFNSMSG